MKPIETVLGTLVRIGGIVGVICIIGLTILTIATVVMRIAGIAFPGSYALSELLLMPAVTFSLTFAVWENGHTRVNFLSSFLTPRASDLLECVIALLGLVFWAFIALATYREAVHYTALGELAKIVEIPVAPFRWMMVIAMVLLCATIVYQALCALVGRPIAGGKHEGGH